jgi:hypothetical protein
MQRRKRSIGGHLARAGRAAALVVAAGAAVPVSARADRRLPHMAARRAAPPQLAVGLRRDRRRAEAGVAGRVQLPQQLGVLGSERPSGPHSRRTPIHGATGVDAELAPLDQLTGASAQPLAERLRAGGHLHRELERVAVLSQRPAVSTAQVRASHGAKPLAAESEVGRRRGSLRSFFGAPLPDRLRGIPRNGLYVPRTIMLKRGLTPRVFPAQPDSRW